MDRPLWQFVLAMLLVFFALQRAAGAVVIHLAEADPTRTLAHAVQVVLALLTALGIWTGRRWVRAALPGLGGFIAATALYEGFFLGARPPVTAVAEVAVVAVAVGGLSFLLRHEKLH